MVGLAMTLDPLTDAGAELRPSPWPGSSAGLPADRLVASDVTPGHALVREEQRQQLLAALDRLATPDPEVVAILGIGEGAAKMRHLRTLQPIRVLMEERDGPEPGP